MGRKGQVRNINPINWLNSQPLFRLRITALGKLRNNVEGLCGTFDDNNQNDFLTNSGRLTDDVDELLKSWVAYGYGNDKLVIN